MLKNLVYSIWAVRDMENHATIPRMSTEFTQDEVRKLADLARIAVTDEEVARLQGEIGSILGYVSELNDVSIDAVDPTTQSYPLMNVLREDTVTNKGGEYTDDLLDLAPRRDRAYLQVKKIL